MAPGIALQAALATVVGIVQAVVTVAGVAVVAGGLAGVVTVVVVRGLTGHRVYESTRRTFGTGTALGVGTVGLYALTVVLFEWVATGRTELLVVVLLVLLASVAFVARPAVDDEVGESLPRPTLMVVTAAVFGLAFLVGLVLFYPVLLDAIAGVAG